MDPAAPPEEARVATSNPLDGLFEVAGLRVLLWLAAAVWWFAPALAAPYHTGAQHDWTYFTHHAISAYRSIVEYHQLPVWDPFFCGGIPALGNVQNNAASPSLLLALIFGLMPGLRLAQLLLFVLGQEGAYRYTRHHGAGATGAVVAGLVFAFSGRFAVLFYDGQPVLLGFLLAPWVLLALDEARTSRRWLVIGAGFMGWIFLEGGAVTTPMVGVVLLLATLVRTFELLFDKARTVAWYRPLVDLATMALLTIGLTAFRFLPVAESLLSTPRSWYSLEGYSASQVGLMLFGFPTGSGYYAGPGTAFVGIPALLCFGYSLVRGERASLRWLVIGVLLFDLTMGKSGPLHTYALLKLLPVLGDLRCPFRYSFLLALFVAVGAGLGLDRYGRDLLQHRGFAALVARASRSSRAVGVIVALTVVGIGGYSAWEPMHASRQRIEGLFDTPAPRPFEQGFRQSIGNRWHAHVWPSIGLGSIGCFEEQPFFTSPALRGDLPRDEYLEDATAGTLRRIFWSPHRIELAVTLFRPSTVLVNQNASRGWRVDQGRIVKRRGLLAVELPAGAHHVVITYRDPYVLVGGVVSLTTLLLLIGLWLRARRAAR